MGLIKGILQGVGIVIGVLIALFIISFIDLSGLGEFITEIINKIRAL